MTADLRRLGEKGLIREVLSEYAVSAHPEHIDDCMIIDLSELTGFPGLPYLVYSVDHPGMIDRPLPPGWRWRFRGRWAAACTCNDVLAMGATPGGFALDLSLPDGVQVEEVRAFYRGVTDVLDQYGARLDGGNVDANTSFETAATAWGTVEPAGVIRRGGARVGDHVVVTTPPGVGWASYLVRRQGLWGQLSARARTELENYNLLPLAPHRAILETVQTLPGALTSGMDLTDGVLEFLYTIRERGGFGVRVDAGALPATPTLAECSRLLGVPVASLAFEYGFDTPRIHGYTVDCDAWGPVSAVFERHGTPLHRIGEVTRGPEILWQPAVGSAVELPPVWYDQYACGDLAGRWRTEICPALDRS